MLGLRNSLTTSTPISGGAPFLNEYSVDFDGTDDGLELGTDIKVNINDDNAGTISMWVKADVLAGTQRIMGDNSNNSYMKMYHAKKFLYRPGTVVNFGATTNLTATFEVDEWFHIVITKDAGTNTNKIYVNGAFESHANNSITSESAFSFDNIGFDGTAYFNGHLSDIAVWSEELDADAVTTIYNSGAPINLLEDSGNYEGHTDALEIWLRFGDGDEDHTGNTVYDMSGNDKHASKSSGTITFAEDAPTA